METWIFPYDNICLEIQQKRKQLAISFQNTFHLVIDKDLSYITIPLIPKIFFLIL